jgi:tetrahydromethanopterin S-methyltransferase subunit H
MNLFRFETEQKTFDIGGVKVGGQPGAHPTVLIGSMFHKGDKLIESRKSAAFDRERAKEYLHNLEDISQKTAIPAMIDVVGNSPAEFSAYLEFLAQETSVPVCIDAWKTDVRIEAARVAAKAGLLDRLVYNSLNPWSQDLQQEVADIANIGVKHVIIGVFDEADKFSTGRLKSLESLIPTIEKGSFSSVLIDTTVMNVAAMAFSLQAGFEIKQKTGLAVGCAPANGTYMWEQIRQIRSREVFSGADAAAHGIAALLWNDFLFYGPLTGTERAFAAAAVADSIKSLYAYSESRIFPAAEPHPVRRLFPDFVQQLESGQEENL